MRAVTWCGLTLALCVITAIGTHHVSKSHYFALGRIDGSIDARVDLLREIDSSLPRVRVCAMGEQGGGWKEVLSVKAGAMYIRPIDDSSVTICRAR
jgi:hypothetical protein